MTTTLEHKPEAANEDPAPTGLAIFRQQDAIIDGLIEQSTGLTVAGLNDRKGLEKVHDARMLFVKARTSLDKTRKKMNEEAQEHIRKINGEAKRLQSKIEPHESRLAKLEDDVEAERERIKQEAENARRVKISARYEALKAVGFDGNMMAVPDWTDNQFADAMTNARAAKAERDRLAEDERQRQAAEQARLKKLEEEAAEASAKQEREAAAERERLAAIERQKQAEEAEARRKEAEKLAAERAELDRQRKEQEAAQAKIDAERRAVELEKARQEAAEKARVETERRLALEAEQRKELEARREAEAKAKAAADEAARVKAEAERPHRDKLIKVAQAVLRIEVPKGAGSHAVAEVLASAAERINEIAKGPLK